MRIEKLHVAYAIEPRADSAVVVFPGRSSGSCRLLPAVATGTVESETTHVLATYTDTEEHTRERYRSSTPSRSRFRIRWVTRRSGRAAAGRIARPPAHAPILELSTPGRVRTGRILARRPALRVLAISSLFIQLHTFHRRRDGDL